MPVAAALLAPIFSLLVLPTVEEEDAARETTAALVLSLSGGCAAGTFELMVSCRMWIVNRRNDHPRGPPQMSRAAFLRRSGQHMRRVRTQEVA